MNILHSLQQLETWLQKNPKPAFVPTMGALHEGHLSLVREAKKSNTPVLTSIFVNPKQFGPNEDFQKYPRDRNGDMKKLASADADAIWFPTEEEVYPTEPSVGMNQISIIPTLPSIFSELEGAVRPSHFLGVAQVLQGFFKIIQPSSAYFGQKDYQQTVLVKWLVKTRALPIEIVICPIAREQNGLAMSSRNEYLTPEKRNAASVLFKSLQQALKLFLKGKRSPAILVRHIRNILESEKHVDSIDYVEIRSADTFEKISCIEKSVVVLLAVRVGGVRLIDNKIID